MTAAVYSQNLEEYFILEACAGIAAGRLLDIGAWNAFDKSNTRALFERGWSGVLIEPSPVPFAGLEAEYGGSDRVHLLRAAVVLSPMESVDLYVSADAISTTEEPNYEKWKDHAHFDGKVTVPAVTLEQIFADHGDFDMVSIDTEGTSVPLLFRLIELGKRPRCIVVEHDGRDAEILAHVAPLGYSCPYSNGENLVLVRR